MTKMTVKWTALLCVAMLALTACKSTTPNQTRHTDDGDKTPIVLPERTAPPDEAAFKAGHEDLLKNAGDMDKKAFMARYTPPERIDALTYNPLKAENLDLILESYPLNDDQKALLSKNGFVVLDQNNGLVPEHVYSQVYYKHLPVMITSDSLLYALHRSYDSLLKEMEVQVLVPELAQMLQKMQGDLKNRSAQGRIAGEHLAAARDVDVYLTVARELLTGKPHEAQLDTTDQPRVQNILAAIKAERPGPLEMFGETVQKYDYSQLKPRGHYTESETLQRYFRSMMWIGRTEMRMVVYVEGKPVFGKRAFASAFLMSDVLKSSGAQAHWDRINGVIERMVGEKDSMDPDEMAIFSKDTGLATMDDIVGRADDDLQAALLSTNYGTQRIMSQILKTNPNEPQLKLPRVYQLMGQRFVLDSYVLSRSTYDRLIDPDSGEKIRRMLPSGLDVQFALGSNAAAELLDDELSKYNYAHRLHELRYVVEGYPESFWSENMYNGWLDALRGLNDTKLRNRRPEAMRTKAWDYKTLNTQLASWAELRHDTLLYAKQSYSGSISCEYPDAYVEPVPVFYDRMKTLALMGRDMTVELGADGFQVQRAKAYFERMAEIMTTLGTIAQKQLADESLTGEEEHFLKATIEVETVGCGETLYDGWFAELFYQRSDVAQFKPTIADVHTAPTDKDGNNVGWVLHAGTGKSTPMIFTVGHGGTSHAYVGPVSTYHRHLTTGFKRLDTGEWSQKLWNQKDPPPIPAWTSEYRR